MTVKLVDPKVYLVGIQRFVGDDDITPNWYDFQEDNGVEDTEAAVSEELCEAAGRICYMSFGKGRKTNKEYLQHILEVGHGSVLEHAVWNFIITGVSRSFTRLR